jgi:hypothetical protein
MLLLVFSLMRMSYVSYLRAQTGSLFNWGLVVVF